MRFLKTFQGRKKSETEQLSEYRQTGDIAVLGAIYQPYMEMVFAICYKYLRQEEESKDAVMQIFEKLVADLRKHEVTNLKSWLHSVARNHCLMQMRAMQTIIVGDYPENLASEPEHVTFEPARLDTMHECLETLVTEQAQTVRLFYLQEKCYREIADTTGFDLNKVKSYIQNGKRNLKICMEKHGRS